MYSRTYRAAPTTAKLVAGGAIDPSGTNDSGAAINTLIATAGEYEFPAGTYIVETAITPVSGSYLYFAQGAILKHKASAASNSETIYIGPSVSDVTIDGATIDGNKANQSNTVYGIFSRGDRVKILNCYIHDVQRTSIVIDGGSTDVEVAFNEIYDSGFFGICAGFYDNETDPVTNWNVHHNRIDHTDNGGSAIGCVVNKADGTTASPGLVNAVVSNNIITRSDHDGFACYSPNNVRVTFSDNVVDNTGYTPSAGAEGGHLCHLGGTEITIANNVGRNLNGAGIFVSNFPNSAPVVGSRANITGNTIYGTVDTTNGEGIVTQNYSDVVISSNRCYDCAEYGIRVLGGFAGVGSTVSDIVVVGNVCQGNDLAGLMLDEVIRATVAGNVFDGNGVRTNDAGCRFEGVINSSFVGNTSAGNTLDGLRCVDGTSSACLDIAVAGNTFANNGGWGTQATGSANRIILSGNVYRSNSTGEHSITGAGTRSAIEAGRTATATSVSMARTDYMVAVTSTASARTITLPNATQVAPGRPYVIKDESGAAATNNISLATVSSQTINGAASPVVIINTNYGFYGVYSDGSNWHRIL